MSKKSGFLPLILLIWFSLFFVSIFNLLEKYYPLIFNVNESSLNFMDIGLDIYIGSFVIILPLIILYYYHTNDKKKYKNDIETWILCFFFYWTFIFVIVVGLRNILSISEWRNFMDIPTSIYVIIICIIMLIAVSYIIFKIYHGEDSNINVNRDIEYFLQF